MTLESQIDPFGSSFFSEIEEFFSSQQIRLSFRVISSGVFVNENLQDKVIEAYQAWLQKRTNSTSKKSSAKCLRRLFDTEEPELFYLIDGKQCIPGYVMPSETSLPSGSKIPRSQASPMSTLNYLHPRDPFLQNIPNVRANVNTHQGLVFKLNTKKASYYATPDLIRQFAAIVRNIDDIVIQNPKIKSILRDCIAPLQNHLTRSRHIPESHRLLVPNKYKKNSNVEFLRCGNIVFIAEQDKLLYCYTVGGKTLTSFVRSEMEDAKSRIRYDNKVKNGKHSKQNPRILGSLAIGGKSYLIHTKAFMRFINSALKVSQIKKALPSHYTVNDCVSQFATTIKNASRLDTKPIDTKPLNPPSEKKHNTKKNTAHKAPPVFRYRSGLWTIYMTKTLTVTNCEIFRHPNKSSK